jgi:hypothetical protein
MAELCEHCNLELDEDGNCTFCAKEDTDITHVEGLKVTEPTGSLEKKDLPRTKPIQLKSAMLKKREKEIFLDDLEDIPELNPEDIKIDFDKIDSSTLFEDDFDDGLDSITTKILPQTRKPRNENRPRRELTEAPLDPAFESRGVFTLRDRFKGSVEETSMVSYRTKGSFISKKGQSLVLFVALAIIFIIIIALWVAGFLEF